MTENRKNTRVLITSYAHYLPVKALMQLRLLPQYLIFLVCFGCAAEHAVEGDYRKTSPKFNVSVTSDGKTVTNFSTSLVHHVEVSERELLGYSAKAGSLPFNAQMEYDREGKAIGIRVSGSESASSALGLGLNDKDIITAIGRAHPQGAGDLSLLFEQLRKFRRASITIERLGVPHKIFYYLPARGVG